MKWLCERQRTAREAWDILVEAVSERAEFFGMNNTVRKLPPRPVRGSEMLEYLNAMRLMIYDLGRASFDPAWFGQWVDLDIFHFQSMQSPDGRFFSEHGIDGYAFYRQPPEKPFLRHTLSDFIKAAAKIVNDVVLYPMPQFNGSINYPGRGFIVEGDVWIRDSVSGEEKTGKLSEKTLSISNENGSLQNIGGDLALWKEDIGISRASGHHWIYHGAGEKIALSGARGYRLPFLRGYASLSCHVRSTFGENYQGEETLIDRTDEYLMDFSSGRAAENIDVSAASSKVDDVLDSENSGSTAWYRWVDLLKTDCRIKLDRENFEQLPYKYLEK